jgi:formylglycine-generating enzyme
LVIVNATDRAALAHPTREMVWIEGGEFRMGSEVHYPEEAPAHRVRVNGFFIDPCPVTNRQFASFVGATGYRTVAERVPNPADYPGALPHMLKPGSLVFRKTRDPVDLRAISNWWHWTPGAYWRHPEGKGSSVAGRRIIPSCSCIGGRRGLRQLGGQGLADRGRMGIRRARRIGRRRIRLG